MRLLLLLLPALGLPLCGAAFGAPTPFQVRCEAAGGETVSVSTSRQGGYSVNNTLSYKTLTQMKHPGSARLAVLGLTKTESRVALGFAGAILSDRASAHECVTPRIEVRLFYIPAVIYVGREFPPGSCSYKEILAHEMRHLNTYLDHLPKVETVVRAALSRRFESKPRYAPAGQARAGLAREIDGEWLPYIKNEMGKVEVLQAAIDSPQEYARLSKVCKGEVQSLMEPTKQARN